MTLESAIIFPLIAVLLFSFVFAVVLLSAEIFMRHEIGTRFLLAVQPGSSLNGFQEKQLVPRETRELLGLRCWAEIPGSGDRFVLFKGNRLLHAALERLIGE